MKQTFQLCGWHVLLVILAFFGAIVAVNVAFAVVAVQSFPGEDEQRSYLQGLHYNQTLADRREQAALGWRAHAALHGSDSGALLEVSLRTRDGAPLDDAALAGALQWPANSARDHALTFRGVGAGRYVASVSGLQSGRWRLRAHAKRADGALDFESELTWQASP